jgi:hypothetical protein
LLTVLSLLLFAIASTAFLTLLGYGPVKLLLPSGWRSDEGLLAPLVGYVLLLLLGYYGVRTALNLAGVLILASLVGAVLIALALWLRRGERLELNLREHGWVWLLALLAFLVAVLPLVSYGYLTPIGGNWDPENYLPVTQYLTQVPVDQIGEMPVNPVRDLNAHPPRIGLTLGFSVLQGVLQQLRGWDARESFAPVLALLRGFAVLALYLLFRRGLRMSQWPALIATFLGGFHALGLWIALFNFGMQMSAMPLVPLALCLFLLALRQPSWRTVLLAAVGVAALPISYYPALTVFVPVAGALGLYELITAEKRRPVLLAGLATALLSPLLALGTLFDYGEGFAFRYSQQTTTLGLFHFISWDQFLGFAPFSRARQALLEPGKELQVVAVVLVLVTILLALWRSGRRWLWLAAILPAVLYLGWLRGWVWSLVEALQQPELFGSVLLERFRPYPYAYMKGSVFVSPLLLGLAVEGWAHWWDWVQGRLQAPIRYVWQAVLAGLLLLPIGLALWSNGRAVSFYWGRPAHFDQEVLRVEEAVELIPEGASVYLTGRPERSRPILGLFSYLLLDHPIYGRLSTAYAGYDYRVPGDAPGYALLDAADDPLALGFLPQQQIWSGGGMVLYERDPSMVAFLDLRADAYGQRPGESIHTPEPLAERLLHSFGTYPELSPGSTLVLHADAQGLSREDDLVGEQGERSLLLGLATLEPTQVTLRWENGEEDQVQLPAGFSLFQTPPRALPSLVEVLVDGAGEVWPCWVALVDPGGEAGLRPQPQEVVLFAETQVDGDGLEIDLHVHNDNGRPLRLALEVWEDTFQGAHHYAWWGLLPLPKHDSLRLRADLAAREVQAWVGGEPVAFISHPGAEAWPEVVDGSYFAALWVYYGHHVIDVIPVGQFRVAAGQVQELRSIDLFPRLLWPHSPGRVSRVRFGSTIELSAYELEASDFLPGDKVPLALEWHALGQVPVDYFVTAQILGEGRLWGQWDGPIGQWLTASAWRPGQYVRDDIPLQVDPETPPGRYRLIVAVYDVATAQRLPVYGPDGEALGDLLDLGELVVRR